VSLDTVAMKMIRERDARSDVGAPHFLGLLASHQQHKTTWASQFSTQNNFKLLLTLRFWPQYLAALYCSVTTRRFSLPT